MKCLLGLMMLLLLPAAQADQVSTFGMYQLHYNTFESTFIAPDIANQYGITRSKSRGLLNVAITSQATGKLPQSHRALVSGTVTNLMGQIVQLSFITIEEGDATYYIAPFSKTDDEILKFKIEAKLGADEKPMVVNFQRHVYVD